MNEDYKFIVAYAIANGTSCDLEHHDDELHEAVDAIIQPLGYKTDKDKEIYKQDGSMVIHVCEECADTLENDPDWALLYCMECASSQWLYLPLAKRPRSVYNRINWLKSCPKCEGKVMKKIIFALLIIMIIPNVSYSGTSFYFGINGSNSSVSFSHTHRNTVIVNNHMSQRRHYRLYRRVVHRQEGRVYYTNDYNKRVIVVPNRRYHYRPYYRPHYRNRVNVNCYIGY